MTVNFGAILALLVIFQFVFVGTYLITNKKGNRKNNRILAFLFFMFAINLLDFVARVSGYIAVFPLIHFLDDSLFISFLRSVT